MLNEKTGLLTPNADAKKLGENMMLLYDSEDLRNKYGKNAEIFARSSFEQDELFKRIIADRKEMLSAITCNKK